MNNMTIINNLPIVDDSIQQIMKSKRETFRVQIRKEKVENDFKMKRQSTLSASK